MQLSDIVTITEQYISPKVLPKEVSFSWIKWTPGTKFDKLILKLEADVVVSRLFNVDNKANDIPLEREGELIIPREMLQINGFFGFSSQYVAEDLDGERQVSYKIDIVSDEQIQTVHLEHVITRPMIEVVKSSPESIQLSKLSNYAQSISVTLKSLATTTIHDLQYVIDVHTNDNLQIDLISSKKTKEAQLLDKLSSFQEILIKGKGYGSIMLSVEYTDSLNTKYRTLIRNIPIHSEDIQNQSFPILENLQQHKTQLLTASH